MEKELPLPREGEASQRKRDLVNLYLQILKREKLLQKNIHKMFRNIYYITDHGSKHSIKFLNFGSFLMSYL